jgi:hypothetical protein
MNGFVHIIESPSADDLLDGRTEGRVLREALRLAGINQWYNLAINEQTFLKALEGKLVEAWGRYKQPPILHLSMHGNSQGVGLTDGTRVSWSDLQDMLKPLTNAMEGGLLICMSCCFSTAGRQMAMHEKQDKPFWALVGNAGSPSWSDAAVAYVAFYHLFFKGIPIPECVDRMKLASNDSNFTFFLGHLVKANWVDYWTKKRRDELATYLFGLPQKNPWDAENRGA